MLIALAWRNLWRRPQRTVLSLASITIVTALMIFMLSFQMSVYELMKESALRIFDGYAQIQPTGYADDPSLERVIAHPNEIARRAVGVGGVTTAAPRVNSFAILANGQRSFGAAVIGVDPASEIKISSIPTTIQSGRYLEPGDRDGAVLGDILARNLGLQVGQNVTILGSARDGSVAADVLKVRGIYHSGLADLDRTIMEMPLARAQDTFGMEGQASTIALSGPSLGAVNAALAELRSIGSRHDLAIRDWGQMEPAVRDTITLKYATSMLLYVTLVSVVAFIILNTLLMSVLERSREFGAMLAMGMRPAQIGQMVWIELLGLALVGCAIGFAIGGGATLWLQHTGIEIPALKQVLSTLGLPSRLYPHLTPLSASIGPGALLTAVAIGGLVPFFRVRRMTPGLAMRGA
jgi:ABC-type lipoprotein release transport system permease subunit